MWAGRGERGSITGSVTDECVPPNLGLERLLW